MDARREGAQPFFAYIPLNAPHAPLDVPPQYERLYSEKVATNVAKFYGMIANLDDNFGRLIMKLREWNLETNTLVIFMTDNGGTAGVSVFNAGMRGGKNTPYLGGARVPSFWRWPGGFKGGVDCDRLAAHIDVFPTFVEVAGAAMNRVPRNQVEGRSLLPLLKNPEANWPERMLVTHIGRWEKGTVSGAKYRNCSIRTKDFQLVSAPGPKQDAAVPRWQLFNLQKDRAETRNVIREHPEMARRMAEAYDDWWREVQPALVNEDVVAPKVNPFKALYWQQFGGGPDDALRRQMDPSAANLK
jgi:arylsulfatase A-like enzyme